jgi:hypothetical protein
MNERSTCCAVSPLRPVAGFLRPPPQIAGNGLDYLFMLIEEIADRRKRRFQNYSLPQQHPIGEAELRIAGSGHGSIRRLPRRHLPLALQSFYVPRCGLVQQFLKDAPVVQTAPNFRHQFF